MGGVATGVRSTPGGQNRKKCPMTTENRLRTIRTELEAGCEKAKCRKCGCMGSVLRHLAEALPATGEEGASTLAAGLCALIETMRPAQYDCLGCDHCHPAVAQNAFARAFPGFAPASPSCACEFQILPGVWPAVSGEYFVLDKTGPVAVSTLASEPLAGALAHRGPRGLAIVGKTETENIGIDKVVQNIVSSPGIRHLVLAGREPKGHRTGDAFLSLAANGVDETGRVVGASGLDPVLRNVSAAGIEAFRRSVRITDMIGCESVEAVVERIEALALGSAGPLDLPARVPANLPAAPRVVAGEPEGPTALDRAGYFVILPSVARDVIEVEHYAYDHTLLRTIEGKTARTLYTTIVRNGWVTDLGHAAYLGKELARAERSLREGTRFVQDGA